MAEQICSAMTPSLFCRIASPDVKKGRGSARMKSKAAFLRIYLRPKIFMVMGVAEPWRLFGKSLLGWSLSRIVQTMRPPDRFSSLSVPRKP